MKRTTIPTTSVTRRTLLAAMVVMAAVALGRCQTAIAAQTEVYDDFSGSNLDTTRWAVELPKDKRLARAHVVDEDLRVYGNGGRATVASIRKWRLPAPGQRGKITFQFRVKPWQWGKYGDKNIEDSGILLRGKDAARQSFGFMITSPKYSDGNYMLVDEGKQVKSAFAVNTDLAKCDHLRITLGRENNKAVFELAASIDGKDWRTLSKSSPKLPPEVWIEIMANWGHLAVESVTVEQEGSWRGVSTQAASEPAAAPAGHIPVLYAEPIAADQKPKIDGSIVEPVWKTARSVELVRVAPGWPAPVTQPTTALVCYDDENLYVAFRCREDSMDRIWTNFKTGGPVWSDDCVELFVQSDPVNRPDFVFHAAVNSIASRVDESGLHDQWTCAAQRQRTEWSVEMAIPFSVLGTVPAKGECWGINFNRQERPHGENSTWGPVRSSFHDSEKYGRIVFGVPSARVDAFASVSKSDESPGGVQLELSVNEETKGEISIASKWNADEWQTLTVQSDARNVLLPWPDSLMPGYNKCLLKIQAPGEEPTIISTGRLWIDQGLPLNSVLWPAEDYDNVLYMADGRMNFLYWLICDTRGGNEGFTAIIEAPRWVEIFPLAAKGEVGSYPALPNISEFKREDVVVDNESVTRVTIKSDSPPWKASLAETAEVRAPFRMWWRATAPKDAQLPLKAKLRFWVSRNGVEEPARQMPVVLLPTVRGVQPKRFPVFAWTNGPTYPKPLWPDITSHLADIGLNGIMAGPLDKDFEAVADKVNLQTIHYCFGYMHSKSYLAQHPDHAAITFDGKKHADLVCPELSLEEGSESFAQASAHLDKYCPPLGLNWDLEGPPIWSVCFCPRCLAAFRKHAGLDAATSLTPKQMKEDPKLNKAWEDFTLNQSIRLAIKWDKRISQARPGARLYINGGQATNPRVRTDGRLDWANILPHIGAGQMFRYINSPQASATTFHAESVRSLELAKPGKTPMMAVLTTGYMRVGERMVFQYPELTTLQMLQMACIGYKGIYYWHWYNNDGRFDNAIARGTQYIARYEDFFLDGEVLDVPESAFRGTKYALVLGRRLGDKGVLFLLNYSPSREAEIAIDFSRLPLKTWRIADGGAVVESQSVVKVGPLDVVVLEGQ
jgi:hypothetical protein